MNGNRRRPLVLSWSRLIHCAGLLGFLGTVGCERQADGPPPPRHVLLITVDTLRPDYLSANGYDRPTTPFLDELIQESLYFSRASTPIPRTTQALAGTLTGCYPQTTQVRTLWDALGDHTVSIAELARDGGYRTVAVVSNHLLSPERRLGRGFEVYDFAPDTRDAEATTQAVLDHLRDAKETDRLFVWVHYIDPHAPYYPPPEYAREFDPGYVGRYALHFGREQGGTGDQAYPADLPKQLAVFRNTLPDDVNAHVRRLYAADIRKTDDNVRTLVETLRAKIADDWLIVFTSDHAESLGEHDFYFDHGDYVYQATLSIPLFIQLPKGHPLGRCGRVEEAVSLIDVMPTLVDLMQLSDSAGLPNPIDGRSLVPCLKGETLPARPTFAECGRSFFAPFIRRRVGFDVAGRFRSVTDGDWKLIWTPGQSPDLRFELYNLGDDPDETRNLYDPAHPQAQRLQSLLSDWVQAPNETGREPSASDMEALRSLGYVGSEDEESRNRGASSDD